MCVHGKEGKLSSSHMNKIRHHSLGSPIFTTVFETVHTYQPLPVPPFCITSGVGRPHTNTHTHIHSHTHTHTHTNQCHFTSSGPGLAHRYSPQSFMKKGNHQRDHRRDRHTVIIRLMFSLPPFFAPSKHEGAQERQLPGGRGVIIQSQDKRVRGK